MNRIKVWQAYELLTTPAVLLLTSFLSLPITCDIAVGAERSEFSMSNSKIGSGSGSHHEQQPHSLHYRKAYESSDPDQDTLQPLHDSIEQADHTVNPCNSNQTHSIPASPPSHGIDHSNPPPTSKETHPIPANLPHTPAHEKPRTPKPSGPSDTKFSTAPPCGFRSDHLTLSDFAFLTIASSPALLHLYGRFFAQTPTARQLGTWFALLILPISAPLYRWEKLPHFAPDTLEVMSYGSAVTVTVDTGMVFYGYVTAFPPTSEAEWLIFYPAVVAAVACWAVLVGFLWACVVV